MPPLLGLLLLKRILQDFIVAEQQQLLVKALAEQALELSREAARANALQIQLESLRAQQLHLYCFKLFGNRYKCGIGLDVDRRIRQHKTTCPSGHLVCSVPITCKAMEKLFESVMKEHGAWTRMEEYELMGSEAEIRSIFAVFSRTEELLNTTPLSLYGALLKVLEGTLGTFAVMQADVSGAVQPPAVLEAVDGCHSVAAAGCARPMASSLLEVSGAPVDRDLYAIFAKQFLVKGSSRDDFFTIKRARDRFRYGLTMKNTGLFHAIPKVPYEDEFRENLPRVLHTPVHPRKKIGGADVYGVVRGWRLRSIEEVLNDRTT